MADYGGVTVQVARHFNLVHPPQAKAKKKKTCTVFPGAIVNVTTDTPHHVTQRRGTIPQSASCDVLAQSVTSTASSSVAPPIATSVASAHTTPRSLAATPPPSLPRLNYNSTYNERYETETKKISEVDHRAALFAKILRKPDITLGENADESGGFRELCWTGVPESHRADAWRILTGYVPCTLSRREKSLSRKRAEYVEYVERYYESNGKILPDGTHMHLPHLPPAPEQELQMRHQIHIDVPRTLNEYQLFRSQTVKDMMERLLYVWSIRNPASGYVQGINDLTTPLFLVFLGEHFTTKALFNSTLAECNTMLDSLSKEVLDGVEADVYWCLTFMLRKVQSNFTAGQIGIQSMVLKLKGVVERCDEALVAHLDAEGLEFLQFSFRWMNCLLVRELPLMLVVRLWDTYLAEGSDYPALHVYVCASLLLDVRKHIINSDFSESMIYLQGLSKMPLKQHDLEKWVSYAYVLRHMYEGSAHASEH